MVFFGRSLVTLPSHVSRPFLLKSLILLAFLEFCQAVRDSPFIFIRPGVRQFMMAT
ncbi:hypothetical protein Cal6303_1954 [Calothrix sp. PCC 6303]|nr:hypothetical protein Cal6303_1954 [Calothrix sp. PCC 6303]